MVARSARTRFLVSGMVENMDCFVDFIEKNLDIILRRFLNENYTSLSLEYDWKIWNFWPKYKIGLMLKVFNIADFVLKIFSFITCAMHKHIEHRNHMY